MRFTYIYDDANDITCLDRYFDYLRDAAPSMPADMAAFAQDEARYTLDGERTLHDAWLLGANIGRRYGNDGELVASTLEIRLLQAQHASEIVLRYDGVTRAMMRLHPDFWPDTPIDLMTHEVTVCGKGAYRHAFQFDRGVYIDVRFREFSAEDVAVRRESSPL
jgi:hypothetical protein